MPNGIVLADVFSFEERRSVRNDATFVNGGRTYLISGPRRHVPRPRGKILVRRRLDGTTVYLNGNHKLQVTELPEPLKRSQPLSSTAKLHDHRPPSDHPWARSFLPGGIERTNEIRATARGHF